MCPAEGGFAGGEYDINGHPVGHGWPVCGTFTAHVLCVSIAGASAVEGENVELTITATGQGSGSVQFDTADRSAVAGSDYSAQSGVHAFSGAGTRTVTVGTIDDTDIEGAESFTVTLSNPTNPSTQGQRPRS